MMTATTGTAAEPPEASAPCEAAPGPVPEDLRPVLEAIRWLESQGRVVTANKVMARIRTVEGGYPGLYATRDKMQALLALGITWDADSGHRPSQPSGDDQAAVARAAAERLAELTARDRLDRALVEPVDPAIEVPSYVQPGQESLYLLCLGWVAESRRIVRRLRRTQGWRRASADVGPVIAPADRIAKVRTLAGAHHWACGSWRGLCVTVGACRTSRWSWRAWNVMDPSQGSRGVEDRLFKAEAKVLAELRRLTGVNVIEAAPTARHNLNRSGSAWREKFL